MKKELKREVITGELFWVSKSKKLKKGYSIAQEKEALTEEEQICFEVGEKNGKQETIDNILKEIDFELRALYFFVKKGHDERIEAKIDVLEVLKKRLKEDKS